MKQAILPWYAWPLTAISLVILSFVVLLVKLPFDQLEKGLRAEKVRGEVRNSLFEDAFSDLEKLYSLSYLENVLHSVPVLAPLIWTPSNSVGDLVNTIAILKKGNESSLVPMLDRLKQNEDEQLRMLSAAGIEELRTDSRRLDEVRSERERLIAREARMAPEYNRLQEEVAVFFNLPAPVAPSSSVPSSSVPSASDRPSFYESGVLRDLPRIAELPDGLEDAQQLRDALDRAGGRVQVGGANPEEEFNAVIADLKKRASRIAVAYLETGSQRAVLDAEEKELSLKWQRERRELSTMLEQEVDSRLTVPSLRQRFETILAIPRSF